MFTVKREPKARVFSDMHLQKKMSVGQIESNASTVGRVNKGATCSAASSTLALALALRSSSAADSAEATAVSRAPRTRWASSTSEVASEAAASAAHIAKVFGSHSW